MTGMALSEQEIRTGLFCMDRSLHEVLQYHKLTDTIFSKSIKVLDYGCGSGQALLDLKSVYGHVRTDGVSLTNLSPERTEMLCQAGITYVLCDVNHGLPEGMSDYDVILDTYGPASYSLTPLRCVFNALQALRKGGVYYCYCTWGERCMTIARSLETWTGLRVQCPAPDRLIVCKVSDVIGAPNANLDLPYYYRGPSQYDE